jgi:hypothetical protein
LKFEMAIWEREKDAWEEREAAKQLHGQAESPEIAVENTPGSNFASSEYRLVNLLYERSMSRLKATHINDQIYSLLGLASDAEKLVPKPNYNTPFRTIMTEIYETLIRETQVLDWICLSGGNDSFDPKGKVAASPTSDLAEDKKVPCNSRKLRTTIILFNLREQEDFGLPEYRTTRSLAVEI